MTAATVAAPANSVYEGNKLSNVGLCCTTFRHTWLTAETDENGDTVQFGYVPSGVVVVGMFVYSADIDTGSNALRQTFKIGTTSVKTADAIASTGGGEVLTFAPIVTTAATLVSVVTTTGANAHTNGVMYITVVYYSGQ